MKKVIFTLFLLPTLLLSKFQVTTYFPLESFLIKTIAQDEVRIKEISNRYLSEIRTIPPSELSRLSNVQAYVHFGLDIEKEYEKILLSENSNLKIVNLSNGITKIDNNPYIWMDPLLLREIVKNLTITLCEIDKSKCQKFNTNANELNLKLDKLFLDIKQDFYKSLVHSIFIFDDNWFYFTNRFRLNTIKRDKNYIKSSDIASLNDFVSKYKIKKLLYSDDVSFTLANSYTTNLNIEAIYSDIFEENILLNYKKLSNKLFK